MLKRNRSGLADFAWAMMFHRLFARFRGKQCVKLWGLGEPHLCCFLFIHDFQLANDDIPVPVSLSPFFDNIL